MSKCMSKCSAITGHQGNANETIMRYPVRVDKIQKTVANAGRHGEKVGYLHTVGQAITSTSNVKNSV